MSEILVNPDRWIIGVYEPEELRELVRKLQDIDQEYDVRLVNQEVPPHHWGGHPVVEAIAVWIPWSNIAVAAASGITTEITRRTLNWLLNRPWLPHPVFTEKSLAKEVPIYGPRGEILQTVRLETVQVEHPDAEPIYEELIHSGDEIIRDPSELTDWSPEDYGGG